MMIRCALRLPPRCFRQANCVRLSSSEELADDGLPKDYKLRKLHAGSRRIDTFVNRATGKGSTQIEKLLMTGKIQVNEEVIKKKSYNIQVEDVIDVWEKSLEDNHSLAQVHRIEIIDYELTDSGYNFNVKSWRNFIVPNWKSGAN